MVNGINGIGIVANPNSQAKTRQIVQQEIRQNELLKKAKTEGLSTTEKIELGLIIASKVLDHDTLVIH